MKYRILMIENDPDDRFLAEDILLAEGLDAKIDFVYSADAHAYINTTQSRPHLMSKIKSFINYWFQSVELPVV